MEIIEVHKTGKINVTLPYRIFLNSIHHTPSITLNMYHKHKINHSKGNIKMITIVNKIK